MTKTVIFVANRGYALTSSRKSIIKRFLSSNWKVIIATADDAESQSLCEMGVILESVTFNRGGISPVKDLRAFKKLRRIYRKWNPALIHHFHAKPVIFGSIAAHRVLGDKVKVVNTITGLGHAFITGGMSAKLAGLGYGYALSRAVVTIFQNKDDRVLFVERSWVSSERAKLIVSSGIDTNLFSMVNRQGHDVRTPLIVMLGRLLRQKGIEEFVSVAQNIRRRWPGARFQIAGEEDLVHPDSVSADWVSGQSGVEYLGMLSSVKELLTEADLFLFPSYREGVPRCVLEAAAMGLPTIAFDVPGVSESVRDGKTGYLVPFREVEALTRRVSELLEDGELRMRMGRAARVFMEQNFDRHIIEEQYIQVYREHGMQVA